MGIKQFKKYRNDNQIIWNGVASIHQNIQQRNVQPKQKQDGNISLEFRTEV